MKWCGPVLCALALSLGSFDALADPCVVNADCNDNNPCTENFCDSDKTCAFKNKEGSCDDGNPCTGGDICNGGGCVDEKFTLTKGSQTLDLFPYTSNKTIQAFYNYNGGFGGGDSDSANTGFEESDTALFLLHKSTNGKLGLVIILDKAHDGSGGEASFSFTDLANENFVVADDESETISNGTINWVWSDCCTDGAAIEPIPGNSCFTVTATTLKGIDKFVFLNGGNDPIELTGNLLNVPIKICSACPQEPGACVGASTAANGTVCNDGDACSKLSECKSGQCIKVSDTDCDDENVCTDDSCDNLSGCLNTANDALCTDGDACTSGDACANKACVSGAALKCEDNNFCTTDSCDKATGCLNEPNSEPCDDGKVCTSDDTCTNGACLGLTDTDCDDGNPCTDDSCDGATGCTYSPNQALCSDGNPCTADDTCVDAACKGGPETDCDDGNPCTDDACDVDKGCLHLPNTLECDDGNACTTGDICADAMCHGTANIGCDDDNPCTTDSCDIKTGCVNAANNGATCEDGDVCTANDSCDGALCVSGAPLACDDDNECTDDSCDAEVGCAFVAKEGDCEDGNPCTVNDACAAGKCAGIALIECDDDNPCTDDHCTLEAGCETVLNTSPCDDGDACTEEDTCAEGACVSGDALGCDDDNPCTDDSCDSDQGCVNTAHTNLCDDGDACTVDDACADGACVSGEALDCGDGNPCTEDRCEAETGCDNQPHNDHLCDDGNACTGYDVCVDGACEPGEALSCDDDNPCTDDSCDPLTGCFSNANTAPCEDDNACTDDRCEDGVCKSDPSPFGTPCTDGLCSGEGTCTSCDFDGDGIADVTNTACFEGDEIPAPCGIDGNRNHCFDNCPDVANSSQSDLDGDGIGDACDAEPTAPCETTGCVVTGPAGSDSSGGILFMLLLAGLYISSRRRALA